MRKVSISFNLSGKIFWYMWRRSFSFYKNISNSLSLSIVLNSSIDSTLRMSVDVELKPVFLEEIYFFMDLIQSKNQFFKSVS